MGTIIKASSVRSQVNSYIENAAIVVEECVEKAGMEKKEIDLLINIGLYRDDNIVEPAIAPLIQQRSKLNLDPVATCTGNIIMNSTFCFDLANGACGFLYAVRTIDSLIRTGIVKNAIIVSGEIHPSKRSTPGFPYTHTSAAMLLAAAEENNGFKGFNFSSSKGSHGLYSYLDVTGCGNIGRGLVDIKIEDGYAQTLHNELVITIKEYIASENIAPTSITHIISNEQFAGFGHRIKDSIGLNGFTKVPDIYLQYGNTCSSSPILGYHILDQAGDIHKNDILLFATSGSGINTACALYNA